ncbi:MAG TPA: translesion DNA synthesis-associated protein ImuA [Ideonella sp.]|uniref:translesion DNA synthesis-associated protein ImuA n=1 Tax=Ideonella sp. TaxID=1929293 RepID=UPI002E328499|nr:translesion DNA synthesis-associated protein ImuA [Ideonella sp.]HEX5687401.1 translesion DNA synthesis-associated protein ImuA [Ideonella sp.]
MASAKSVPGGGLALAFPGRAELLAQPTRVHPGLWRAQGGAGAASLGSSGLPSGFAALDAELPGGGWPVRVLTELLLPGPGVGEIRLLAPLLASLARSGRGVMLFDPPAETNAVALAELGWPPGQCIVVRSRPTSPKQMAGAGMRRARRAVPGAELCWAIEQALRSGQVGAVLAWPGAAARPEALRRLQLAAQSHEGPAFLLRELSAQAQPSPAPLRVLLQPAGADDLQLQIIKRKGPAMAQPLQLTLAPVLSERALARAKAVPRRASTDSPKAAGATALAATPQGAGLPGSRGSAGFRHSTNGAAGQPPGPPAGASAA